MIDSWVWKNLKMIEISDRNERSQQIHKIIIFSMHDRFYLISVLLSEDSVIFFRKKISKKKNRIERFILFDFIINQIDYEKNLDYLFSFDLKLIIKNI